LPIGVQVVGEVWREDVVIATARQIEATVGGWSPPPGL
jgi:Asp-tRNA(Asn)/Glu-tRNA(Gln) amidotransferase A subunit family amidase